MYIYYLYTYIYIYDQYKYIYRLDIYIYYPSATVLHGHNSNPGLSILDRLTLPNFQSTWKKQWSGRMNWHKNIDSNGNSSSSWWGFPQPSENICFQKTGLESSHIFGLKTQKNIWILHQVVHPGKLTWIPKVMVWKCLEKVTPFENGHVWHLC